MDTRASRGADGSQERYLVRAVARALDILDILRDAPEGRSLASLADQVRLPKSSVFRYLATLEAHGYVQQDRHTGDYRFGLAAVPSHTHHLQVLSARARPLLSELRDRLGETINLAVLEGNRIAYLEILESTRSMRLAARVGDRVPAHSSAVGKAIMAMLPRDDALAILRAEGMPRLTPNTITDPDVLLAELETVRRTGRAIDDREHEEDGRCVAVPIPGSRVPAAISLSAPAVRFGLEDVDAVAEELRATAAQLGGGRQDGRGGRVSAPDTRGLGD
jgi:IclR family transcriptional regulator, acetate operon repressor